MKHINNNPWIESEARTEEQEIGCFYPSSFMASFFTSVLFCFLQFAMIYVRIGKTKKSNIVHKKILVYCLKMVKVITNEIRFCRGCIFVYSGLGAQCFRIITQAVAQGLLNTFPTRMSVSFLSTIKTYI